MESGGGSPHCGMTEGGEGCGPCEAGARSAAQPMTAGQAAGRSGRDPQHVALSSRAAFTLPAFMLSFLVDRAQPRQLFQGVLDVYCVDLAGAVPRGFLEGSLPEMVDRPWDATGDAQE